MSVIVTVLVIGCFVLTPVAARAGGGGGSSSHPSSTGGYSGGHSRYGYVSYGIFCFSVVGILYYHRHKKARVAYRKAKKELDILDDQDEFWNEKNITKAVERSYYAIQEAWSKQDSETLKQYLTPSLLEEWQVKFSWQEFKGQRNVLKHIHLIKRGVVDVYDSENDDEDYFWVYIEGAMDDQIVDEDNHVLERNTGLFIEYWKYQRHGNQILLDQIDQKDEYENKL